MVRVPTCPLMILIVMVLIVMVKTISWFRSKQSTIELNNSPRYSYRMCCTEMWTKENLFWLKFSFFVAIEHIDEYCVLYQYRKERQSKCLSNGGIS